MKFDNEILSQFGDEISFISVQKRKEIVSDIPKASMDTKATSPGNNWKNFFPACDLKRAPENKPTVFITPSNTLVATCSVATVMFLTL